MKSMKGLGGVNRMLGSVRRRATPTADASAETTLDTPEANASRSVKLFCESGGPNHTQGDEVLHLPTIVEAAESTPAAAKEAAYQIRKALSNNANATRPYVQYNAVMLLRILSDNPGPSFTKNIDKKFVETVKELIRYGKDPSVQQILRETLETFSRREKTDNNLHLLVEMWKKEKVKIDAIAAQRGYPRSGPPGADGQNYFSRSHANNSLPSPEELVTRMEEARTSAKLLTQLVQSTPPTELLQNDLVGEFADRVRRASRSLQAYMQAQNPGPDDDTMLTLIETSEQLSLATSKYQRAVLQAKKATGQSTPANGPSPIASPNAATGAGMFQNAASSSHTPPPPPPPRKSVQQAQYSQQHATAGPSGYSVQPTMTGAGGHSQQPEAQYAQQPQAQYSQPPAAAGPSGYSQPPAQAGPSNTAQPSEAENPFADSGPVTDQTEPYHPGFNPTRSYMGRQDSAINKVTMHAAGPPPVQEEQPQQGPGAPADAKDKGPVYRY